MIRALAIAFTTIALSACSSSTIPPGVEEPVINVVLPAGQFMPGPMSPEVEITLIATIYNRSDVPIELRKIQFRTTGTTSVALRSEVRNVSRTISAREAIEVELQAVARVVGPDSESEPIRVRGTAIFEAKGERFRKIFTSTFNP